MHILIAPGTYKNSLSAEAVAEAITHGLQRSGIQFTWQILPIADGGNGTLSAFLANGGKRITKPVQDPLGRTIEADFGILPDNQTAIIEMALASGLELITDEERNPLIASTYGTGQLLQCALDAGAKRIIIGMGGSATVDGGAGCLQALGIKLRDSSGNEIVQGGGSLNQIHSIDTTGLDPRWQEVEIIIASDVENPTLGNEGAAAVFGPQKGASSEGVKTLETNLTHFFTKVYEQHQVDVRDVQGGGAAGALSAGLMAFLGGQIESGIDLLLEHNHFEEAIKRADLVITGEGQMDEQTVYGKGPVGIARLARKHNIPTVAIVGGLNVDDSVLHEAGIHSVLPIVHKPMPLIDAINNASELVERTALRLGYLLQLSLKN